MDASNWEQEVTESKILTVVYFWHNQCPWCARLNPILEEISQEYQGKIKFVKLNILESPNNQEMATNLGIMSTPTLMYFCNGRPIGQTVGFMLKDDLNSLLSDIVRRHQTCLTQSTDLRNYIV